MHDLSKELTGVASHESVIFFLDLCRGQECGPLYVVHFIYNPFVVALKPEDIKVCKKLMM